MNVCVCVYLRVHLIAVSHIWNGETKSSQRTVKDQVSFLLHDMNVITLFLICKCARVCVYVLIFYLCYVCYFFSLLSAQRIVRRDYNKNWYPALFASYYISFQLRIRYPHDTLYSTPVNVCVFVHYLFDDEDVHFSSSLASSFSWHNSLIICMSIVNQLLYTTTQIVIWFTSHTGGHKNPSTNIDTHTHTQSSFTIHHNFIF